MARWKLGGAQSPNACLNALPPKDYRHVRASGDIVELDYGHILRGPGEPITSAWFPLSAIVSLQLLLAVGGEIEVAMVGREGMVGATLVLAAVSTNGREIVQVAGSALCIEVETFRRLLSKVTSLQAVTQRSTEALLAVTAQNIGCLRSHTIPQRAAHWLLLTHDRMGSDRFDVTQTFLAQVLQVRRASVSEAQSRLQLQGYIRYSRGSVEIIDREALETLSCECYWTIRKLFEERVHV